MTLVDVFHENVHKRRLGREFERVFNTPLSQYFDNFTGFDSIRFDEEVIKSGKKAMVVAVKEQYGDKGVKLIMQLLR